MIEFVIGNTVVRFDFSFFAVGALFLLFGRGELGALAFAFCAVHEMSHLLVMIVCGVKIHSVSFCGAGIGINALSLESMPFRVQAAIICAGSAVNFALAAVLALLDCDDAAVLCLLTGAINLLPVGVLDGARLLKLALIRLVRAERVDVICRGIAIAVCVLCFGVLACVCKEIGLAAAAAAMYFILMNMLNA